jgi:predicted enzyme related to lactoylglutathione lyase
MIECSHVLLAVSDIAEARAFYIDQLGLEILEESPRSFSFRIGAIRCSVMPGGTKVADDVEAPAPVTLMLRTGDLDASIAELAGRGVQFIGPATEAPGFMRHAPFIDQDNNLLYLCEYVRDPLVAV